MMNIYKISQIREKVWKHLKSNNKEYILTGLVFIIGLFIGVLFVNNLNMDKTNMISDYIKKFINDFKQTEQINKKELFMTSIRNNIFLIICLWVSGTTIIGMPVTLGIVLYRGFCLGTTISSITLTLGLNNGITFCLISMFLQNLFFIPAIITIGVSSIKLYKEIVADRRKENIKIQIISHTMVSLLMLLVLIFCSFLENKVSIGFLKIFVKSKEFF